MDDAHSKIRLRFGELVFAIVCVVAALIWAERLAWNQISTLRQENQRFIDTLKTEDETAAQQFLANANASLVRLQRFLFVALLCLLASGATIIVIAYRRMITPLRARLSESRAIIDRQEKLASLGVFATGIAHEIRNPLTAIKVRLFSLKQNRQPGASEHEDIQVIESEIERLERIVKEFLQFARPPDPNFQPVSLSKLLHETKDLLAADLLQKGIRLDVEIQRETILRVDPDKLKQVLLNFIRNGAESISGNGEILLRSRSGRQTLHGQLRQVVIVDVIDTGSGMTLEIQKRLFDPFFTNKENGTGLGLPIAARIIEKHGGAIEYQTVPGQGTRFSIILPQISNEESGTENIAR